MMTALAAAGVAFVCVGIPVFFLLRYVWGPVQEDVSTGTDDAMWKKPSWYDRQ